MSDDNKTEVGEESTEEKLEKSLDQETVAVEEPKAPRKGDPLYVQFVEEVEGLSSPEEKLGKVIAFMEEAIAQTGSPNFRNFWESRKLCLPLFKEHINPVVRAHLWERYGELTQQARRLKELFDEETAFAVEQIEMAISALEKELETAGEHINAADDITLPESETLRSRYSFYNGLQKELQLLNAYALRINGLRKELIKTEMRVRQKNQFFQRLSDAGNKVFPRRKELIKEVSDAFVADVNGFVESAPSDEKIKGSLHDFREEIKALQSAAKALTLNTRSFSGTRGKLSGLWDRIRDLDKEKKKQWAERREELKGNAEEISKQIEAFSAAFAEGGMGDKEAGEKLNEIQQTMRQTELARPEVKALKDQLSKARDAVYEKANAAEKARQEEQKALDAKRREELQGLQERLSTLVEDSAKLEVEALVATRDEIKEVAAKLIRSKAERQQFDRLYKSVKDAIADKKEQALLDLPGDERAALEQLKEVLSQRKERRKEIKEQLEQLRRLSGSSGLDFDQAITAQEQINEEKERLEKASAGILEIEEKIDSIEKRVKG